MGKEIRRVPPNWKHPENDCCPHLNGRQWSHGDFPCFKPMFDEAYEKAAREWIEGLKKFKPTRHSKFFWEYEGNPPDPEMYRPEWKPGEATWWQVYETVSEGTPVTPPFKTPEELIDYLATKGDFWNQRRGDGPWSRESAEEFVNKDQWRPSFVVKPGVGIASAKDKQP